MHHRVRGILHRLGNEAQDVLRQQRAHMVHKQTQIHVVRIQMESEQGASLRIIASVSHEHDLVRHDAHDCATAIADPMRLHSFLAPKFKIQLEEYFHDTSERNLVESYRLVAERDRVMFEGRGLLHKYAEEKKKSETWQDNFIQAEKAISELLPRLYCRTRYWQINAIAQ